MFINQIMCKLARVYMEVTVIMFEGVPELYNSVTHTRIPAISSQDSMCS